MAEWFEDYEVGRTERFGHYPVTREEVIDFARRYDPQPFHLDDAAAAANPIFGKLSASGWHTAAMTMRMSVDFWASQGRMGMGSPGIDEMRFLKPVFPGDTLHVESEVVEARPLRSKPDRGVLRTKTTVLNQNDERVLSMLTNVFIRRRPQGA